MAPDALLLGEVAVPRGPQRRSTRAPRPWCIPPGGGGSAQSGGGCLDPARLRAAVQGRGSYASDRQTSPATWTCQRSPRGTLTAIVGSIRSRLNARAVWLLTVPTEQC